MAVNYDDIKIGDAIPSYTSGPITRTHLVPVLPERPEF